MMFTSYLDTSSYLCNTFPQLYWGISCTKTQRSYAKPPYSLCTYFQFDSKVKFTNRRQKQKTRMQQIQFRGALGAARCQTVWEGKSLWDTFCLVAVGSAGTVQRGLVNDSYSLFRGSQAFPRDLQYGAPRK